MPEIIGTTSVVIPEVIAGRVLMNAAMKETPLLRSRHVVDLSNPENGVLFTDGGDTVKFLTQEFGAGVTSEEDYVKDMVRDSTTGATGEGITIGNYTEPTVDKTIPIKYDYYALKDAARQGDVSGFIGTLVARSQATKIQKLLMAKANADGGLRVSRLAEATKTLTVDSILIAKLAWGDKAANFLPGNRPGMYIHTKQWQDLATSADYKSLGTAATTSIVQVEAEAGALAVVHGVVLYQLDTIPNQAAIPAITTITRSSGVATVTTAAAHNVVPGDIVSISGATQTEYNGDQVVVATPTSATLTFAVSGTPTTPATGSPVFTANYNAQLMMPGALGLLIKDLTTHPPHRYPGTSIHQLDTDFRVVTTRFKQEPKPTVKFVTR